MAEETKVAAIDEQSLRDKIYIIRGQQVLLDSDLALVYGYETRYLNLQVKHNINRFPDDFMFRLTKEEYQDLMLKKSTSSHGGRRTLPYVFTEQGVYQLATVLKGEVAEQQSIAIMRAFRAMREYLAKTRLLLPQQEFLRLSTRQSLLEGEIREIKETMVAKTDLPNLLRLFENNVDAEELLILDGEPFKADLAYQKIYRRAKKNVIVIDDYISTKTLAHLTHTKGSVRLTVISDNKGKGLKKSDYEDFLSEYPSYEVTFIQTEGRIHDRYIILDQGTRDIAVYHCGASSKDAGKKITTITAISETAEYQSLINNLLANTPLILR